MAAAGGLGLSAQIQQSLAYWRTRIEAIRTQWLGRLGVGGLIPKTSALTGLGFTQPARTPTRRTTTQIRTQVRTPQAAAPAVAAAKVGVPGERYDMSQKILVPGERYDFSYKTRRVGAPGERYDFTY
jgi:hypothetical protein